MARKKAEKEPVEVVEETIDEKEAENRSKKRTEKYIADQKNVDHVNKVEPYIEFFDSEVHENEEEIRSICSAATCELNNKFRILISDPKLLAVIFRIVYDACVKELLNFRYEKSEYKIKVCDRFEIGYTTNDNEDDEKPGNFMFFMKHLNSNKKCDLVVNMDASPATQREELTHQWNVANIIDQSATIHKIIKTAINDMKKYEIYIGDNEDLVMPMFITTYENIVNCLQFDRAGSKEFEVEINFMNCFYIGARESGDDLPDTIYIRPNIEAKLDFKSDAKATSIYEN